MHYLLLHYVIITIFHAALFILSINVALFKVQLFDVALLDPAIFNVAQLNNAIYYWSNILYALFNVEYLPFHVISLSLYLKQLRKRYVQIWNFDFYLQNRASHCWYLLTKDVVLHRYFRHVTLVYVYLVSKVPETNKWINSNM